MLRFASAPGITAILGRLILRDTSIALAMGMCQRGALVPCAPGSRAVLAVTATRLSLAEVGSPRSGSGA